MDQTSEKKIIRKIGLKELFVESSKIIKDKYREILKLFGLSCALTIFSVIISQYIFKDVLTALMEIKEKDSYESFANIAFNTKAYFFIYNLLIFVAGCAIQFSIFKVIENNYSVKSSLIYIKAKLLPIISTLILSWLLVIIAVSCVSAIVSLITLPLDYPIWLKIIIWPVTICTGFFVVNFSLRVLFTNLIVVLEDKYYFQAIMRSLSYSYKHVLKIYFKLIIVGFVCLLMTLPLAVIVSILSSFIFPFIDPTAKESLSSIAYFLPFQFFYIALYLIYSFYKDKEEFPEEVHLSERQVKILKIVSITLISTLLIVGIFAYFTSPIY